MSSMPPIVHLAAKPPPHSPVAAPPGRSPEATSPSPRLPPQRRWSLAPEGFEANGVFGSMLFILRSINILWTMQKHQEKLAVTVSRPLAICLMRRLSIQQIQMIQSHIQCSREGQI